MSALEQLQKPIKGRDKRVIDLYLAGWTKAYIAKREGFKSSKTVKNILRKFKIED